MSIFKNLFSRHLLGRETAPSSLQPAARCPSAEESAANRDDEEQRQRTLPANHPESIRVRRMAAGLIAAACDDANYGRRRGLSPRIRRPFRGVDWSVTVVDDARYENAFSTRDGRVTVTTGLLAHRDTTVAAVLAHEVGHVIARHVEKRNRNWTLAGFLANFAGELLDVPPGGEKEMRSTLWSLFMRPCYHSQEYEADHIGLLLVAAAGYDPRAVLTMYRWLWHWHVETEEGSSVPDDLLSRHPRRTKRLERLSQAKVMDQALDLYRQAAARSARQGCELR